MPLILLITFFIILILISTKVKLNNNKIFILSIFTFTAIIVFLYSASYVFKRYIQERKYIFTVSEPYYTPQGCQSKIFVRVGYNGVENSDLDIQLAYVNEFYKHCVFAPNVVCDIGDVAMEEPSHTITCRKKIEVRLKISNEELVNTFPYNILYNLY